MAHVNCKMDPNEICGTFKNINFPNWAPVTVEEWKPICFNQYTGNEVLRGNLSKIVIPQDGIYTFRLHYNVKANGDHACPSIGIKINDEHFYSQAHLQDGFTKNDFIFHMQKCKVGDIVTAEISGHSKAEYSLNDFSFRIEKLSW